MTLLAKLTILLELQYKTHAKKRQGALSFSKNSKVLHAMKCACSSMRYQEFAACSSWTNWTGLLGGRGGQLAIKFGGRFKLL